MNKECSAEKIGCEKIAIKDLQTGDMFSFDGEKIFIFSRVSLIRKSISLPSLLPIQFLC